MEDWPCYSALFSLSPDYTFTATESEVPVRACSPSGLPKKFSGHWSLSNIQRTEFGIKKPVHVNFTQTYPPIQGIGDSCLGRYGVPQFTLIKKDPAQWEAFHGVPLPPWREAAQRKEVTMRCGVPPEEQIPDTPCCTEEVTIIANQLWPVDFPEKVKPCIISEVASACMKPPGMTDNQLKIAIAKLIAANR